MGSYEALVNLRGPWANIIFPSAPGAQDEIKGLGLRLSPLASQSCSKRRDLSNYLRFMMSNHDVRRLIQN